VKFGDGNGYGFRAIYRWVYVWYDKFVERDEELNCLRKETVFEAQRTFFTLVVGGGKSFTWKGWDVRWGIGNVLFWWNSLWGQAAYDPAAAYKTSPLLYMHLRRPL